MNSRSAWITQVQMTEDDTGRLLGSQWDAVQVRLGLVGAINRGGRLDVEDAADMVKRVARIEEQLDKYHAVLRAERGRLREESGR